MNRWQLFLTKKLFIYRVNKLELILQHLSIFMLKNWGIHSFDGRESTNKKIP